MKIGTILENKNTGMRVVIGAGEEPRWLNTGEPLFNRIDPDEWVECEVRRPEEPSTITIAVMNGDGAVVTAREVRDAVHRINSEAPTRNRIVR